MLVDFVLSALALADPETVLDLSTAARHVSEVLLGIDLVAILVDFADFAQKLERTASSRPRVYLRLVWTASLGGMEGSGVDIAHLDLEPVGGDQ